MWGRFVEVLRVAPFTVREPVQKPPIKIPPGPCVGCRHYDQPEWACKAFPMGIPEEIRRGEHSHRVPYPGDGGIRFDPIIPEPEIPPPPQGSNTSKEEVRRWLGELQELEGEPTRSSEFRERVSEQITTARLWLDWLKR